MTYIIDSNGVPLSRVYEPTKGTAPKCGECDAPAVYGLGGRCVRHYDADYPRTTQAEEYALRQSARDRWRWKRP